MFVHVAFFFSLVVIAFVWDQGTFAYENFLFLLPYLLIIIFAIYHFTQLRPRFREWEKEYGFTWSRTFGWYFFELALLLMSANIADYFSGQTVSEIFQYIVLSALMLAVVFQIWDLAHRSTIKTAQVYNITDAKLPKIKHIQQHPVIRNILLVYLYVLYAIILSSALGIVITGRPMGFIMYFSYLVFTLLYFLGILPRNKITFDGSIL